MIIQKVHAKLEVRVWERRNNVVVRNILRLVRRLARRRAPMPARTSGRKKVTCTFLPPSPVCGPTVFVQVVKLGNAAVVQALLRAGADPNLRDPVCGLTAMHDAAREGFVESVRALVDYGADLNLVDEQGNLPLHLAAREGHLEATQMLIGRTADPRGPNGLGYTAGQLAHIHKRVECAKYIHDYLSSRKWSSYILSLFHHSFPLPDPSLSLKDGCFIHSSSFIICISIIAMLYQLC